MDAAARGILKFWLEEVGPDGWYEQSDALDDRIRAEYGDLWAAARNGRLNGWTCGPDSTLALLVLLDQFPRNMFRGDARSFATDARARAVAKNAVGRRLDRRIEGPARQFFYMPFEHSEAVVDQARSVRLVLLNIGQGETLEHARAHRHVIRRFGRFPFRNEALRRRSSPDEQAFLEAGGYRAAVAAVAR